jgi:[acyl-carrier-protein] S-malonyltransferase
MRNQVLLFAGQGAQAVGMGQDLARQWPAARAVFSVAGEELGLEVDKLCFDGPIEELSRSDVAQPAILAMSIAALKAMESAAGALPELAGAAGLSLGEYTALVAAGAIELRAALRLVRARGTYMQKACDANPGTMYSIIGLRGEEVEQACRDARDETGGGVWPANYNSPDQIVISGQEGPAHRAAELCSRTGARRSIRLNVAGPFHTPLMQSAADSLAPLLDKVPIRDPACPVVANATGRPAQGPAEIRQLLLSQITSPVRWLDCMQWFISEGVTRFFEVGPGRVIQGLLRRTNPACTCTAINSAEAVEAFAKEARADD